MKYTVQEYIVLILCAACTIGIFPLFVLRVLNSHILIATIDGLVILTAILVALYVVIYRKIRVPSIILTVLFMASTLLVVHLKGASLMYWAYPASVTAYFLLKPSEAAIGNIITLAGLIPVIHSELDNIEFVSIVITLVIINVFSFLIYRSMFGYQNQLAKLATRDFLTGTGNRRLFDEHIELCISMKKRYDEDSSLIVLDVDKFKIINDTFGHGKGDEVLNDVIALLRARLRESDDLYRIGGDEFAILLRGSSSKQATEMGELLRNMVQSNTSSYSEHAVTISLGVTEITSGDTPQSLLDRADSALYKAKKSGRNRVCIDAAA